MSLMRSFWRVVKSFRVAFNKFRDRRLAGWQVNASNEEKLGKLLFLESLGIKTVKEKIMITSTESQPESNG